MNDQIKQIEMQMEDAKHAVEMAEAMKRLEKNKDFQKVVTEGYYKEEASRVVLLLGEPGMQADANQKMLNNILGGIASFFQYCNKTKQIGEMARQGLEEAETVHEQLLQEEMGITEADLA